MRAVVSAPRLFDGDQWREGYGLLLEDGRVTALRPVAELPAGLPRQAFESGFLVPGFIDLQVNGGGDVMFNSDPTSAGLERIASSHRKKGTTGMLPTLVSDTPHVHRAGVEAVRSALASGLQEILGIHLEGPFFEPQRRGAHRADMIRPLAAADIDWLCGIDDLDVTLTLAPELTRAGEIRRLAAAGLRVCAGHTDAGFERIQEALGEGLRGFTHLYNAMGPLTAREPGVVGAALVDEDSWVGIIADGHHVHPVSLQVALRAKARGKVCLVSDAMATVGGTRLEFELYGETIREQGGRLVNAEGVLAGSAIGMIDAVRYCHRVLGVELGECLRMASLYPAGFLDRDGDLGRLAAGYRADLLLLDEALEVRCSWVAGVGQVHA